MPFATPYLRRKVGGKYVTFDVTLSTPDVRQPLNTIVWIMQYLREQGVTSVLDFGAGKLRNTWSLLKEPTFSVHACEFEKVIKKGGPLHKAAIKKGLKELFYPADVLANEELRFEAILLSYVLHIVPDRKVRRMVLGLCADRLADGGWLVVASPKFNTPVHKLLDPGDRYQDGWVRYTAARYKYKSFYSEPAKSDLIKFVVRTGFDLRMDWQQSTAHVLGFEKKS
jgi:hypothetical protein